MLVKSIFKKYYNYYPKITSLLKNKFAQGVSYVFISYLILGLAGFVINLILGFYYTPADLGIFNQCFALTQLFSVVGTFGIVSSNVHFVAQHTDDLKLQSDIQSSAIILTFSISLFLSVILYILGNIKEDIFFNKEVNQAFVRIVFVLPFMVSNRLNISYINAIREMKLYSILQSARWLLLLSIVFIFTFTNQDINTIVQSFLLSEIILFFVILFIIRQFFKFTLFLSKEWVIKHLYFGGKTLLVSIISETNGKIDIFLISFFLNNYNVGIYSFASTICNGILMIPSAVATNFNPIISKLWYEGKKDELQQKVNYIKSILKKIMIPVVILSAIVFPIIVFFIMNNKDYAENIHIYYIILIGVSFLGTYNFMGGFLTMTGKPEIQFLNMLVEIILNIILNIILINLYGITGAAISMSLLKILGLLSMSYFIKWKTDINLLPRS